MPRTRRGAAIGAARCVGERGRVSDQARVALAFALALLVMVGWYFLNPPKPQPPPGSGDHATAAERRHRRHGRNHRRSGSAPASRRELDRRDVYALRSQLTGEKNIVVESDLYRVELSNRGAVVRSWQLKKYTDEGNPPHTLDLVNADLARQTGSWPLSLQFADAQLESAANQGLYVVKASSARRRRRTRTARSRLRRRSNSTGAMASSRSPRRLKFDRSYILHAGNVGSAKRASVDHTASPGAAALAT